MNFLPSGATYKNRKMPEDSYNATYDDCTGFYLKNIKVLEDLMQLRVDRSVLYIA